MNTYTKIIVKSIILDQICQEFSATLLSIKNPVVGVMQNTMFKFLSFFLEAIRGTGIWWPCVFLILAFNLVMPKTTAIQNAIRVSNHSIKNLFRQSIYSEHLILFMWFES